MSLVEHISGARLLRMLMMATLGMIAIYCEAAPLGIGPDARPSPDILLCVVAYWSLRRPGSTPMLLVFALGLMRDLITDVPVGAGALSLVLTSEILKSLHRRLSRSGFAAEWVTVVAMALLAVVMQWLLVLLTLAQPPYLSVLWHQILYTAALYPVVAAIFRWLMRISWRKVEAI